MANREVVNSEQRLTFGRFVLDLGRGVLLRDGREVALGPKAFAVMCYLVQHPGRPVSRAELLAAAWPNLVVGDDALVQSIGELRRALGEPGPRLIVTVGEGWRFDADAAPPDRRKSRQWKLLRWRQVYGILAPLVLLLTFVVLWLGMRSCST
ncbi:MAG: transcriptional regulator [Peristeroidobacter soli]